MVRARKLFWDIKGYDRFNLIFDKKVSIGSFSDEQVKYLLMALVAKTTLSFDRIVGAYAKRKTKIANDLLMVTRYNPYQMYTCGNNPYFIAAVVDESGKPPNIKPK